MLKNNRIGPILKGLVTTRDYLRKKGIDAGLPLKRAIATVRAKNDKYDARTRAWLTAEAPRRLTSQLHAPVNVLRIICKYRSIFCIEQWRRNHEVGCRAIAGSRDVVQHGDSEQGFHVNVVRLRLHRIP